MAWLVIKVFGNLAKNKSHPHVEAGLFYLALVSIILLVTPLAFCQEPEDEIVDIQVNSMEELKARQRAEALNNQGYEQLEAEHYLTKYCQ